MRRRRSVSAPIPEGHPLIAERVLLDDLLAKDGLADYMVTQMCFDAARSLHWLSECAISVCGSRHTWGCPAPSTAGGCWRSRCASALARRFRFCANSAARGACSGDGRSAVEDLREHLAALVGEELGVAGIHFYTFNRLVETVRFAELLAASRRQIPDEPRARGPLQSNRSHEAHEPVRGQRVPVHL